MKKEEIINIKPVHLETITLRIKGNTPLIMHAWSEKAKQMMLDAQMGKAKGKAKEYKNPVDDFIRSMYWLTPMPTEGTEEAYIASIESGARFGFPVTAFKQATISAAYRMGWSKDKVSLQGAMFFEADQDDLLEIHSDTPVMREDMVRVGMGTADIRYRGELRNWFADLRVKYNANGQYSLENIVNMINAGGLICGVGEWRVEKGGQNGMYMISQD